MRFWHMLIAAHSQFYCEAGAAWRTGVGGNPLACQRPAPLDLAGMAAPAMLAWASALPAMRLRRPKAVANRHRRHKQAIGPTLVVLPAPALATSTLLCSVTVLATTRRQPRRCCCSRQQGIAGGLGRAQLPWHTSTGSVRTFDRCT